MGGLAGTILAAILGGGKIIGLTLPQWEAIIAAIVKAEPQEKALLAALWPAAKQIGSEIARGLSTIQIAQNRVAEQIPGYGPDGGVIPIHNPDYQ